MLRHPFSNLRPFLGFKLFGRHYFAFLGYLLPLFIPLPFLVCLFRRGSVDREKSWRSGLDGYFRSRASDV